MANRNQTTGRNDENTNTGWRPQDDAGGQGQSGYAAGRRGDERAFDNHNQGYAGRQQRFEGNTDDRWSGRGGSANYTSDEDRDYYPERYESSGYGGHEQQGYQRGHADPYNDQRFGRDFADRGGFDRGGFDRSNMHRGSFRPIDRGAPQRMKPVQTANQSWHAYGPENEAHRSYGSDQSMYGQGQRGWGNQQGQAGMHRGKGPKGYQRSDERILEAANEALEQDDHVDATHIEVVVKNGDVTLTGTVEDRAQKRRAEECVEHLAGVKDVQNNLRPAGANGNGRASAMGHHETETSSTLTSDKKARA